MSPQTIISTHSLPILSLKLFTPMNSGETSDVLKCFQGIVKEKNDFCNKFISYKVFDKNDPENFYKVLCFKKDYLPLDNMSFLEMHEDVEEGDLVSIQGFAATSKKGNAYLRAANILVREYGNNEYETTDHEESDVEDVEDDESVVSDPEYTPSESSEEEDVESDTESVHGTYEPTVQELMGAHFEIPDIPLTIYKDFVQYQSLYFSLDYVRTNTPFKLVLGTEIANFHITKMGSDFIGVFVSKNSLEPDHPYGYDMILSGKFSKLLKTLM